MAGVRLNQLAEGLGTSRAVRALPNAATEVGMSYTLWMAAPDVDDGDRASVGTIFDACGIPDDMADRQHSTI